MIKTGALGHAYLGINHAGFRAVGGGGMNLTLGDIPHQLEFFWREKIMIF
jgi:hypothetical protein